MQMTIKSGGGWDNVNVDVNVVVFVRLQDGPLHDDWDKPLSLLFLARHRGWRRPSTGRAAARQPGQGHCHCCSLPGMPAPSPRHLARRWGPDTARAALCHTQRRLPPPPPPPPGGWDGNGQSTNVVGNNVLPAHERRHGPWVDKFNVAR